MIGITMSVAITYETIFNGILFETDKGNLLMNNLKNWPLDPNFLYIFVTYYFVTQWVPFMVIAVINFRSFSFNLQEEKKKNSRITQ